MISNIYHNYNLSYELEVLICVPCHCINFLPTSFPYTEVLNLIARFSQHYLCFVHIIFKCLFPLLPSTLNVTLPAISTKLSERNCPLANLLSYIDMTTTMLSCNFAVICKLFNGKHGSVNVKTAQFTLSIKMCSCSSV